MPLGKKKCTLYFPKMVQKSAKKLAAQSFTINLKETCKLEGNYLTCAKYNVKKTLKM